MSTVKMVPRGTLKKRKAVGQEQLEIRIGSEIFYVSSLEVFKVLEFQDYVSRIFQEVREKKTERYTVIYGYPPAGYKGP